MASPCNAICPGYVWTPLVEAQIPDTMAARKMTKEQVIEDVLLKAQPTKQFVTIDEVARFGGLLGVRCGQRHDRQPAVHRRRLDGSVRYE